MNTQNDKRIVMTLDAGGTNFVFSAIQGNVEIVEPIRLPSNAHDLELCLSTLIDGFSQVKGVLSEAPVAISFAFPGPADYPNGIIGDLGNLPAFRGGVALGPMLEEQFGLPVFINNDGDLFAYGEAIAGFLPHVNELLAKSGSPKRFKNLIGITLGTGFGAGLVRDGELLIGDNSGAGEVWLMRNKLHPEMNAEESISIRAIQRVYAEKAGLTVNTDLTPKDIFDIAAGDADGDSEAAKEAFRQMGEVLGDALSHLVTLVDGVVVIGGGVAGAHSLILPATIEEMRSTYVDFKGVRFNRLVQRAFNLEVAADRDEFLKGDRHEVKVPGTDKIVAYDPMARTAVGISQLGASKAISIGAYAFALHALDK